MAGGWRRGSFNPVSLLFILLLASCAYITSCAHVYTAHGVYYRVQKGDTLAGIAHEHHTTVQELAEINNMESEKDLKVGSSVFIPGVTPSGFAKIIGREGRSKRHRARREAPPHHEKGKGKWKSRSTEEPASAIEVDHDRFIWPVVGDLSSLFGIRHGRRHDGIDIRAKRGTPVLAAADGEVVFSKRMQGYGNLVLVKHEGDFFTVYAHNSVNLVKKGQGVKRGEVLSKVGRTGRATGPHLHFEVREGTKPRNPLFFLPKNQYAQKAREGGTDHAGSEE